MHYESVQRQTGKPIAALQAPPFPDALAYLWRWFQALHRGRTRNGMALTPASHVDLMAWQWNTGIRAEPWEVEALMRLGFTWVSAMTDDSPKAGG